MSEFKEVPHGYWNSRINPSNLSKATRFIDACWDENNECLVWLELSCGRRKIMCQSVGSPPREVATQPIGAGVGYGGGDIAVHSGNVYFIDSTLGSICRTSLSKNEVVPITVPYGKAASPTPSPNGEHLAYVQSDGVTDGLVIISTNGNNWAHAITESADFYMQPCWHPDGTHLAWVEWDHPNMPWDGSRLMISRVHYSKKNQIKIDPPNIVAGGIEESIFQPSFYEEGKSLIFASDRLGWSNIWSYNFEKHALHCITPDEFDIACPAWIQGLRSMACGQDGFIYFIRSESNGRKAYKIRTNGTGIEPIKSLIQYEHVEQISISQSGSHIVGIVSSPKQTAQLAVLTKNNISIIARSTDESSNFDSLSYPKNVSWPTKNDTIVHGLFYPPTSSDYKCKDLPPLIINIHSGPTSQIDKSFEARAQFFATRGWAFLDVNYRGSTGHGREYMKQLHKNWGIVDVEDTVSALHYMRDSKNIDPNRVVICGSSAGGYTVLRVLTMHPGMFKAGLCIYGISDLFSLTRETHKFEAHYLDKLIGTLPDCLTNYNERSPIFSAKNIVDPLAIFHGSKDAVVPISQAKKIVDILRKQGTPHAYHTYKNEGHGWKNPETIQSFYENIDAFLRRYVL
jgi:dipeptidyl aminopeptidase/acylaminoacyl peptidase